MLIGAWVFDGFYRKDFRLKWKSFLGSKVALSLAGLFILYLAWSLFSDNDSKALKLVIDKLPLLLLPLSLSGLEIPHRKAIDKLFSLHIAAILVSTALSYVNWKINGSTGTIRDSLLFVNHIRLSLMMVLSISLLFLRWSNNWNVRLFFKLSIVLWFLFFMYEFQLVTGFSLALIVVVLLIVRGLRSGRALRWSALGILLILSAGIILVVPLIKLQFDKPEISSNILLEKTLEDRTYYSIPDNLQTQNGNYVWHYIQLEELKREWNLRSSRKLANDEGLGSLFIGRIIRYMTSKDLRKDAEGVKSLSAKDIQNIENGWTSVKEEEYSGLQKRIAELLFEIDSYLNGGNPSLSSLTVKFEYWKTGWRILQNNMLTGVGVGDVRDEFNLEFEKGTQLSRKAWDKTHNQYLTWAITFGVFGALLALILFVAPGFFGQAPFRFQILLLYLVFLTSFVMEDTLETQLGLNLFLFYIGMLVMPSIYLKPLYR